MNIHLIEEYVNKLTKSDIINFASKQGITLDNHELELIYHHIKDDYKTFLYGNPRGILDNIKKQVKPLTYNKIETLYLKFKDRI